MFEQETTVYSVSEETATDESLEVGELSELSGYAELPEYEDTYTDVPEYTAEVDSDSDEAALETALAQAYALALAEDTPDPQAADEDTAPMVQNGNVAIYTTAVVGDLPGTIVLEKNVGEYNGRVVRKVICGGGQFEEQRKQYAMQGRIARSEAEWQVYVGKVSNGNMGAQAEPEKAEPVASLHVYAVASGDMDVASTGQPEEGAVYGLGDTDIAPVGERQPEPEVLNATPEAREAWEAAAALAAAVKTEEEELAEMMAALKAKQEGLKAKQLAAEQAQQAAPIPITAELRAQIDLILRIVAKGEDGIARAITNRVVEVRMTPVKKASTAQPGKAPVVGITRHSSSNGSTTNGGTASGPKQREVSDEEVRRVRSYITQGFGDTAIAKALGIGETPAKGSKIVFHIRHGHAYKDVL